MSHENGYLLSSRQPIGRTTRSTVLGHIVGYLNVTTHRTAQLGTIIEYVEMPIILGQADVFMNNRHQPVGVAAWAFVTQHAREDLLSDPPHTPLVGDWNGGDELFVTFFSVVPKFRNQFVSALSDRLRAVKIYPGMAETLFRDARVWRRTANRHLRKTSALQQRDLVDG